MYEDTYPWPIKCHICLGEFTVEVGRHRQLNELEVRKPLNAGHVDFP
jgi:hypothetical protein